MTRTIRFIALSLAFMAAAFSQANAQATSGSISGVVTDERQGAIANATVTARNVGTNESRVTTVDNEGRYRFSNLPVGNYEITVQANGFAKLVRSGVELLLNQDAIVNATLKPSTVEEVVTVAENASLLNTTNAEVSTRFDPKRLSELPLAPNRNILNAALSAAGYLCWNGKNLSTPRGWMKALRAYNNSDQYARTVRDWATAYAGGHPL